ncbi:MAG: Nif3-like dinuclear metal center hexameric protein [Microbacteriaceae bacterium]
MASVTLHDVIAHAERLWPSTGAEEWDVVGLVSGSLGASIARVLFVVDVTDETITEAIEGNYDLMIAHHPLLLRGVTTVAESAFKGSAIARLIRANCALVTIHTNGDRVATGTSASLAAIIGVTVERPLVSHPLGAGLGARGIVSPTTLGEFARAIANAIPATAGGVKVSGDMAKSVTSVALCAGAGDSLLGHPDVLGADVYVTSDLRHHPASEFRENARLGNDTALVDISHWAAEWLWLDVAAEELRQALTGVSIDVSEINTDPWNFVVVQ